MAAAMDKVQSDLGELKTQGATVAESLKAMTETLQGLKLWMPRVDGAIGSLQQEIKEVGDRVVMLEATKTAMDEVTPVVEEVHHEVGARSAAIRNKAPAAQFPRGKRILHHTPVQFDLGDQSVQEEEIDGSAILESRSTRYSNGGSSARMPKTDFPKFDGENPKWWKGVAEKYFSLYNVSRETWASFATMHFKGNAALWLQTYEAEHEIESWEELVVEVHSKFGKDRHHKYLEALERCKQTDTVDAYYQKFEELRHKVLVNNKHYDEAFFVTKFVNGLKREIQRAIRLHKPKSVDVALSLAETQEEMMEETRTYMASRYKNEYKMGSVCRQPKGC